jgi:hypothetical protein
MYQTRSGKVRQAYLFQPSGEAAHAPSRVLQEQLILDHVIDSSAFWSEAAEI